MNILENLLYTKEHEWLKIEGNLATVGITDYAQRLLGDITFVELPKAGDKAAQGKQFASVESIKAASDVYAPLSGKIIKVNTALADSPQLVNQYPYTEGWFVVIEIENEKEKQDLLSGADYKKYLEGLPK